MKLKVVFTLLMIPGLFVGLANAPSAKAFCKGCNYYIECGVKCYKPGSSPPSDPWCCGKYKSKYFEERAVDGKGKNCNIFGCSCNSCEADMSSSELAQWCVDRYLDQAKSYCSSGCPSGEKSASVRMIVRRKGNPKATNRGTYTPADYWNVRCN